MIVSIDGVVIKEVTLAKDRTTLGRRPYNDIVIDNLAISGEHAVLHMIGGDVYLEDLNRSEEHTSELQSLMRISYAVFCLKKKKHKITNTQTETNKQIKK